MARIIISYRRSDSAAMTRLIFDRLVARFGENLVFMDIDNIPFGVDFRRHIRESLLAGDVLLAIVGSKWTGIDASGQPRILEENDPVRVEIETAFENSITVMPVLIDHATMPQPADLPETLANFPYLNAIPVDSGRDFRHHMDRLIRVLEKILAATGELPKRPAPPVTTIEEVLRLVRSPFPWIIAATAALPLLAAVIGLSPPWPRGVAAMTAVVAVVATGVVFYMLKEASYRATKRVMRFAALALAVTACAYLVVVSLFTFQTPTTKEYWAKGFVCTAEALAVYKEKCPNLGIDELREAEYEAERLWTSPSVTTIRVALVLLWLGAFVAVAAMMGSFLASRSQAAPPLLSPAQSAPHAGPFP
jgi:hypothetical protein